MVENELRERILKSSSIKEEKYKEKNSAVEATEADELLAYNEETEHKENVKVSSVWDYTPLRQLAFLGHLFFARKFFYHRVSGLVYLIQYALAFYLYFKDYDAFLKSPLVWSLPLNGVIQSVTAIYTFTFLPKKTKGGL